MKGPDWPLTDEELQLFIKSAERLHLPHRIIANVVPFTGLAPKELVHLRTTYIGYSKNDGILTINLPETVPCTSVVFETMGTHTVPAEQPCNYCNLDNKTQDGRCSTKRSRTIHVTESRAQNFLQLFFRFHDEMPLSNPHKPVKLIVEEADFNRRVNYNTLIYTRIRRLADMGLGIADIVEEMGLQMNGITISDYSDAIGRAFRESSQSFARKLRTRDYVSYLKKRGPLTPKTLASELDRHPKNVAKILRNAAKNDEIPIDRITRPNCDSDSTLYDVPGNAVFQPTCTVCGREFDTYNGKRKHESAAHNI